MVETCIKYGGNKSRIWKKPIIFSNFQEALGAKHYWWMDDPTVFGDGPSSNLIQKPANANQAQQPPEQKYQNPPAVQQPTGKIHSNTPGPRAALLMCLKNTVLQGTVLLEIM